MVVWETGGEGTTSGAEASRAMNMGCQGRVAAAAWHLGIFGAEASSKASLDLTWHFVDQVW